MEYYLHLAVLCCLYLILSQSYNLIFGVAGLFNLAHVAAYSIGAYSAAILSTTYAVPFFPCLLVAMCMAALLALLLGAIALRLSEDYFAIGSLAFSFVVVALLINWKELTNGVLGIPGIPRPQFWQIDFYTTLNFLLLIGVFSVLTQLFFAALGRGAFYRALRARAEYAQACAALGINTRAITNLAFVISSAFAGLAGAFFAFYLNYIDPSSFSLNEMVFVLTIVVLGRPGSLGGCIAATIFLVLLPEPLRRFEISPSHLGQVRQLLYASILFVVVYFNRHRIFPSKRHV